MVFSDLSANSEKTLLEQCEHLREKCALAPDNAVFAMELAQCYVKCAEPTKAVEEFQRFMRLCDNQLRYLAPFCNLLHQYAFAAYAAQLYERYSLQYPSQASLVYNHAYYLRFAGSYHQAITQYKKALQLNISQPEEVMLNIAVIYSDHLRQATLAEQALMQALQLKPDYIPALYNLANLAEEQGDKTRAEHLFRQVITVDRRYYQAYARLADIKTFEHPQDPIILNMLLAVSDPQLSIDTKINLHFALGKAFDDCKLYADAAHHFITANNLNASTMPAYDPLVIEQQVALIMRTITPEWLTRHQLDNKVQPIFICGMFRSGSTLAEQILSQHGSITAGGEIEFFWRELKASYPEAFARIAPSALHDLSQRYIEYCKQCFGRTELLTDKRPDNYLFMGLLKALFPKAKFIYTLRNQYDNCLSIYFLRLAKDMNYANKIEHILHYYQQHELLMMHWQKMFGSDIYTLDYDALVQRPEATLQGVMRFLSLDYTPTLLAFHNAKNPVKTASVWQVRRPLYQHASGRHRYYMPYLPDLLAAQASKL